MVCFGKPMSLFLARVSLIGLSVLIFIGISLNAIHWQKEVQINEDHLSKHSLSSLHDGKEKISDGSYVKVPAAEFMAGKLSILPQNDVQIIDYIWRKGLIQPPSRNEYNLENPEDDPSSGQGQYIRKLMKDKANGFFVGFCGAMDGETRSNTLFMEKNLNWRGLLIEADPSNFALLTKKNRKAWTSNTCLSIVPYPHTAIFHQSWSVGKIVSMGESEMSAQDVIVQCMPLFSLLAAINVTTVDYFSLDVEGSEFEVLRTIPFDKVFIRTLSVEFLRTVEEQKELRKFMESQGYKLVGNVKNSGRGKFADDLMFVHKDANIED